MFSLRRIATGLFALYLMVIVFIPCADMCDAHEHKTPTTLQAAQDHHGQEYDLCSPFCVCSCCSTTVTVTNTLLQSDCLMVSTSVRPGYAVSFPSCFATDFWQPPRLS